MVTLRDVIRYHPSGTKLIAEAKLTEAEFDRIKTLNLIGNKEPVFLPTSVYWYEGGHPPKPVYHPCPVNWRGKLLHPNRAEKHVNVADIQMLWIFEYKPVRDSGGGLL